MSLLSHSDDDSLGSGGGSDGVEGMGMRVIPGDLRGRGFFSAYDNILEVVVVTDTEVERNTRRTYIMFPASLSVVLQTVLPERVRYGERY